MHEPDPSLFTQLVTDHVSDGIVLTDAAGTVLWINPAFTRICGYDLNEMLGKRPGDVLQGEQTSLESRATLAQAIATRSQCTVDIVNYTKSGSPYISEINLGPIFNAQGELTYFVAVERDVTSERSLMQESIDFKAYQRAIDQQAMISVTDARGNITYVNAKFCAVSGYTSEELIGQTHSVSNSGSHDPAFFENMWHLIATGHTWHDEICNVTKTGELYWADTTITPLHGTGGEIQSYVSILYETTERKAVDQRLQHMAETDALTGLANRARFVMDLRQSVANAVNEQGDGGCVVILLDIDNFTDLNDASGHHVGDLLLKEIALRLKDSLGPNCVVARVGGDEFAAVVRSDVVGTNLDCFIRSLHGSLCAPIPLMDAIYLPGLSLGVTLFPNDANTVDGLMINADLALRDAKRNGWSQCSFFDPETQAKSAYRNQLKTILADALDNDRFEIAMQPICCMQTGKHRGFEILVRLTHDGKSVPPDHFIPLAEDLGLVGRIDRIVRRKAMMAYRMMVDLGLAPGKIAINVAAQELREPRFVEDLHDMLSDYGLEPSDVVIEITETALIGKWTDIVASALRDLQKLNIQIALDDFGTGFSSLSHLRDFQVDKIKIDRSFVKNLEHGHAERALVDGLIFLAQRLGLEVVAEGVETLSQHEYLRQRGCHYLQGYLHSKPLPVGVAIDFLQAQEAKLDAPENVIDFDRGDAEKRVAYFLLELGSRLTFVGLGSIAGYACPLTQDQISDSLKMNSVLVNQTFRKLREADLVTLENGQVTFVNYEALVKVAAFNPDDIHQIRPNVA